MLARARCIPDEADAGLRGLGYNYTSELFVTWCPLETRQPLLYPAMEMHENRG